MTAAIKCLLSTFWYCKCILDFHFNNVEWILNFSICISKYDPLHLHSVAIQKLDNVFMKTHFGQTHHWTLENVKVMRHSFQIDTFICIFHSAQKDELGERKSQNLLSSISFRLSLQNIHTLMIRLTSFFSSRRSTKWNWELCYPTQKVILILLHATFCSTTKASYFGSYTSRDSLALKENWNPTRGRKDDRLYLTFLPKVSLRKIQFDYFRIEWVMDSNSKLCAQQIIPDNFFTLNATLIA